MRLQDFYLVIAHNGDYGATRSRKRLTGRKKNKKKLLVMIYKHFRTKFNIPNFVPFISFYIPYMDHQSFYRCFHFVFALFLTSSSFTSGLDFSFATGGFDPNDAILIVDDSTRGKSEFGEYVIRLIDPEPNGGPRKNSTGRAYSAKPFQLWDPRTKTVTDFTTSFDFAIWFSGEYNSSLSSGGLAFFITSKNSLVAPPNSAGKWLGLFNETNNGNSSNQMVAVEFDTFKDEWDPSNFHVGLNVNSIASENYIDWNENMLSNGETYHHATISYNGTSKNFSVVVKKSGHSEVLNFTYNLDLSTVLPEKAYIGFSASSGQSAAAQVIISWNFTSAMGLIEDKGFEMWKVWVIVIAILVFIAVLGLIGGIYWRNSRRNKKPNIEEQEKNSDEEDDTMDMDFAKETGPKRFTFKGLAAATGNFSEEGKLGQGGFGGVYKGYLAEENVEIAVKKVASNSKQGKKEYVSEVKTISHLRHRNLVQLIGWSHQNGNFLLVYEYMSNGSLDAHLYGESTTSTLPWSTRFNIVKGLASALVYLHEEGEHCVIHRDIKPSNVMLDRNFNAKLGAWLNF